MSHIVMVTFFEVSKPVEATPEAAEPPLLEPGLPQAATTQREDDRQRGGQ